MPLLTEQEKRRIIELVRNAKIEEDRRKIPCRILRYVCVLLSIFFVVLTVVAYFRVGGVMCAIPLSLAVCWLFAGIVFHIQWLRYMELAAFKSMLPPAGENEQDTKTGGEPC